MMLAGVCYGADLYAHIVYSRSKSGLFEQAGMSPDKQGVRQGLHCVHLGISFSRPSQLQKPIFVIPASAGMTI